MFNPYSVILYAFLCAGLGVSFWGWRVFARSRRRRAWPRVSATVVALHPAQIGVAPRMEYVYQVAGNDYRQELTLADDMPSRETLERFAAAYQPGTTLTVHCDPQHPARATLDPGGSDWLLLATGVLTTLFAILFIIFGS